MLGILGQRANSGVPSRARRALALIGTSLSLIGIVVGCAGRMVARPPLLEELPQELPKELHEKFEVKEGGSQAVEPKTAPAVADEQVKPKSKSRRKARLQKADAIVPFSFPSRRPVVDPMRVGEKVVFDISWLGLSAGSFTLEVLPYKNMADRKVYHLRASVVSSDLVNMIYRFNDTLESFLDFDGLFSHRFHMILDESKQARDSLELYDSEKKQSYYWNRWNRKDADYIEDKKFVPIERFPQDGLSATYYMRTVPMPTGSTFMFPLVNESNNYEAHVTVIRRELLNTGTWLGKVPTVVVQPRTKRDGNWQNTGEILIWFTDDERRYPVRLEGKVKIGKVVLGLKDIQPGEDSGS